MCKMTENWIGKSVSIQCRGDIGIFQGTIKRVTPADIVITRVVRNGLPLKKQFFEITLTCKDIEKLDMISSTNVPNLFPGKNQQPPAPTQQVAVDESLESGMESLKVAKQSSTAVRNKTPPSEGKVTNGTLLAKSPGLNRQIASGLPKNNGLEFGSARSTSRPIDINTGGNPAKGTLSAPFKNDNLRKKSRNGNGNGIGNNSGGSRYNNKNSAFGTPVDDPMMDEEFDFEKNLALFDKQAIWDEIDAIQQKPDVVRQTVASAKKTYRHDENILASVPTEYRQIQIENSGSGSGVSQEYVTDAGLVIPSIPRSTRDAIQQLAENHGLTMERQNDLVARATADVAVQLLGGSRRLTPKNQHQWPKIVIVCDEPFNERLSEIGIATGRMLACHGLKVVLFVAYSSNSSRASQELELYAATGNLFTRTINALPSSDLVITAIKSRNMAEPVRKWLAKNRAPVLAIDPPAGGLESLPVKCSILPILPLNDLGPESVTGRLYLCNLGIPDKFFTDSGIKYKSPFDKAVIPIHRRTE